jgi:hypothetical protein
MENLNYVGPYPEPSYYGVDNMSNEEQVRFFARHDEQKDKVFDNKEELLSYCIDDVNVLRMACCSFRNLFFEIGKHGSFP